MTTLNNVEAVRNFTRTSQIIVAALAGGLAVFLAVVLLFIEPSGPPAGPGRGNPLGLPFLTLVALGFAIFGVILSLVAPGLVVNNGLRQIAERGPGEAAPTDPWKEGPSLPANDVGALLPLFQTQLIIASALVEGAAFFALIAFMVERHPLAMGIAVLLIAVLLSRFPIVDRVQGWLDDQSARLARIRRGDS